MRAASAYCFTSASICGLSSLGTPLGTSPGTVLSESMSIASLKPASYSCLSLIAISSAIPSAIMQSLQNDSNCNDMSAASTGAITHNLARS